MGRRELLLLPILIVAATLQNPTLATDVVENVINPATFETSALASEKFVNKQAVESRIPKILPHWWSAKKNSKESSSITTPTAVLPVNNTPVMTATTAQIQGASGSQEGDEKKEKNMWKETSMSTDGESDFLPLLLESNEKRSLQTKEEGEDAGSAEEEPHGLVELTPYSLNSSDHSNVTEVPEGEGGKRDDVGEILDHLLDKLEEEEDKGAGRFNETLEKQEGTLEWVARVGKHHQQEDEKKEEQTVEEEEEKRKEGSVVGGEAGKEKEASMSSSTSLSSSSSSSSSSTESVSLMDLMLGKEAKTSGILPDASASANETTVVINGQVSSGYKSEGEIKEMSEQQALLAKKKREKEKRDEAERQKGSEVEDVPRLIDSNDNEYVISNPGKGSKMQMQEDLTLISDIVKVIVAAAMGALACGMMGQPLILGYLAAGMLVGPGGFRLIHELVQVETLAQFGVIFLLFALGIEFNLSKMQGCQAVALGGGGIQIVVAMVLGGLFSTVPTQGIFIGAFLSMSSTAVVIKCLMDSNLSNTEYGQIMLGTLILQDCALGLLLAVMPALASQTSSFFTIGRSLAWEFALLAAFCSLAWLLTKLFVPAFLRVLTRLSKYNGELYQLGCVGLCLCLALCSEYLGLSLEVGAFVAGLMLSGGKHSEKTLHHVEPIRNIFAALFLASIGMVMNPEFLWKHKGILLTSLAVVFFGKACLIALTVRLFGYSGPTAVSVGIALSQIGEFSFVLLSRAQVLKLVSHKMYLLLMGTTALSLVLTPFSFKIVVHIVAQQEKGRQRAKGSSANGHAEGGGNGDDGGEDPPVSPLVVTTHRDSEAHMVKRNRTKGHGGEGSPEEDHEYDDEKANGKAPKTPGKVGVANRSGGAPGVQAANGHVRGSPRTPRSAGIGVPTNHFADTLREMQEMGPEEEREAVNSPMRGMMRRSLGQSLSGKWKAANDHNDQAVLSR